MLICSIPKWDRVVKGAGGEEGGALSGMRGRQNTNDFSSCLSYPCQSVDGLIGDFITKSSSRYKAAYVYFTDCK